MESLEQLAIAQFQKVKENTELKFPKTPILHLKSISSSQNAPKDFMARNARAHAASTVWEESATRASEHAMGVSPAEKAQSVDKVNPALC